MIDIQHWEQVRDDAEQKLIALKMLQKPWDDRTNRQIRIEEEIAEWQKEKEHAEREIASVLRREADARQREIEKREKEVANVRRQMRSSGSVITHITDSITFVYNIGVALISIMTLLVFAAIALVVVAFIIFVVLGLVATIYPDLGIWRWLNPIFF